MWTVNPFSSIHNQITVVSCCKLPDACDQRSDNCPLFFPADLYDQDAASLQLKVIHYVSSLNILNTQCTLTLAIYSK